MSAERLQPVAMRGDRWRVVLEELPGLVGLVLVSAGVYLLAGLGWTLVAAGAPLVLAYVLRETRLVWRRRRKP